MVAISAKIWYTTTDMEIVNANIEKFLSEVVPHRDAVLSDMEEYAASKEFPIVGPVVGRFLYVMTRATRSRRVLELGSGFGYSAYWFANAAGPDGKVVCTEGSPQNEKLAKEYFKRGRITDRIEFHVGEALNIIDELEGEFDIIFNDLDKAQYPKALKKALPKLKKGGLFIADNVLWGGKVLDKKPDAATAGILTFDRMVYGTKELFTTIVPLRDGVSVSIRL